MTQGKYTGLIKLLLAALLSIALVSPLAMPSLAIADQLAQQQEQVDGAQSSELEGDTQADDAAVGTSDAADVPNTDADSTDNSASADTSDISAAADPAETIDPGTEPDPDPAATETEAQQPHVLYKSHVQTYGWESDWSQDKQTSGTTGQSKRIEGVYIRLDTAGLSGSIQYRAHVQTYGWMNWVDEGQLAGTTGQSKRVEAIQVRLTGEMADLYDIYYRVHAQHFGWLGWAKNGASAGTSGYSYRLEAIQVVLVEKDGEAPGSTADTYLKAPLPVAVNYRAHIQGSGWEAWRADGKTVGTARSGKRVEAFNISIANPPVSGGVKYRAHVQGIGWQGWASDGALVGTTGKGKRVEAVQVQLTGQMARNFDIYYRTYVQYVGWSGWAKNGASSGTQGFGMRIEAMQVQLVKKGKSAPGSTTDAFVAASDTSKNYTNSQKRILAAANSISYAGSGRCAMWVSRVYNAAGYRYIGGNANDQWRQFCDSDDLSDLKPGMVVGVEKSPSVLGRRYGHVGIYVGNGVVRHNSATALENTKLGEWLDTYNYSYNAAWGFMS